MGLPPGGAMTYDDFEGAFREIARGVVGSPEYECAPRGQAIREAVGHQFGLSDPRRRLVRDPARAANYGFAAGEFLWYWRGADDVESIAHYNARMRDFSDDGVTLRSAYGRRIFRGQPISQWEVCRRTLASDRDSRRAVMSIYAPQDGYEAVAVGSKDVPCTTSLQFLVRGAPPAPPRLHLVVTMRSNDVVWGLTNDLFSFTLLQECMLLALRADVPDLELGGYVHQAGSMHVYERHFEMVGRLGAAPPRDDLPEMPPLTSVTDVDRLAADSERLRLDGVRVDAGAYSGGERWLAERLNLRRGLK